MRNALMLALVGCTAFGRVYAQQRDRAAARDAPAAITGHVVSDGTPPQPLRRVIVTLGGSPQGDRRTVTDDDGTFGFPGLAPGRYTVTAAKAAFLTTAYGATAPGGLGTTLAVATGAHLDVTLTMARGAVIEGTILDQTGQPVPYVSVGALVSRDGAPLKAPAFSFGIGSFGTDDRGMYRIFGLPPGDYVVRATRPMLAATGAVDRPSAQDVTATLGLLSRGRQAAATQRAGGGEAAEDRFRHVTYAPVYYPGVNMEEEAVTIALHAGEERRGVDFTLNPAATAFVRGRISGAARDLGSAQVMLESRGEARAAVGRRGAVSHDGSFTFEDVVPGHYRVLARADPNAVAVPASSGPRRLSVATPESDAARTANIEYLWASTDVDVLGQDLDGLQLTLQPGARLDGHVRPDGAGSIAPELLTGVQLSLVPTRMSGPSMVVVGLGFTMVRTAAVGADGTFSFVGIGPGQVHGEGHAARGSPGQRVVAPVGGDRGRRRPRQADGRGGGRAGRGHGRDLVQQARRRAGRASRGGRPAGVRVPSSWPSRRTRGSGRRCHGARRWFDHRATVDSGSTICRRGNTTLRPSRRSIQTRS